MELTRSLFQIRLIGARVLIEEEAQDGDVDKYPGDTVPGSKPLRSDGFDRLKCGLISRGGKDPRSDPTSLPVKEESDDV